MQQYRDIVDRGHDNSNSEERQRYHVTQNGRPVRQEVTGYTDNGNIFATETSRNEIERWGIQGQVYDAVPPDRPIHSRNPQQSRERSQPTARAQEDRRKKPRQELENRSFRSQHAPSNVFERSSVPFPPLEQPRGSQHCCICGTDIPVRIKGLTFHGVLS